MSLSAALSKALSLLELFFADNGRVSTWSNDPLVFSPVLGFVMIVPSIGRVSKHVAHGLIIPFAAFLGGRF
ncbi:hypothetical protein D3C78_1599210 [compost metagenome]